MTENVMNEAVKERTAMTNEHNGGQRTSAR